VVDLSFWQATNQRALAQHSPTSSQPFSAFVHGQKNEVKQTRKKRTETDQEVKTRHRHNSYLAPGLLTGGWKSRSSSRAVSVVGASVGRRPRFLGRSSPRCSGFRASLDGKMAGLEGGLMTGLLLLLLLFVPAPTCPPFKGVAELCSILACFY